MADLLPTGFETLSGGEVYRHELQTRASEVAKIL